MNNFTAHIIFQDTIAEYDIYQKDNYFRAELIISRSSALLPKDIIFRKEKGCWKTNQMLDAHVHYQFAFHIDNHLLDAHIEEYKLYAA